MIIERELHYILFKNLIIYIYPIYKTFQSPYRGINFFFFQYDLIFCSNLIQVIFLQICGNPQLTYSSVHGNPRIFHLIIAGFSDH